MLHGHHPAPAAGFYRRLLSALLLLAPIHAAFAADLVLQQADGSELILPGPAGSLVTLSPHLSELVYAAGAGDLLLATVEYSEFPAEAAALPRVGDAFRIDVERIVALQPALVIAWDSGNPRPAVEQLTALGLTVWRVEIRELEGIAEAVEAIGRASGRADRAAPAARRFRERTAALRSSYRNAPTQDYFYQVAAKPLFTINGDHLISKGLALCGGRNVFAGERGLAFQVSHEAVIAANPDALIAPWLEGQPDPFGAWREWPRMQAVSTGALIRLDADRVSRATPRFIDALEHACAALHEPRQEN